jgi:hypothetical protein
MPAQQRRTHPSEVADDRDRSKHGNRDEDRNHHGHRDHDRDEMRAAGTTSTLTTFRPGLSNRDQWPPGLERQLVVRGTGPPGLRNRICRCPDDFPTTWTAACRHPIASTR